MEHINLLIGKYFLERPDAILELSRKYILFTTDIENSECANLHLSNVEIVNLTAEEMLLFASFLSEHQCLNKVGFYDASVLFVAAHCKMIVAVADVVTRQVCNDLGIDILDVNINHVIGEQADNGIERERSKTQIQDIA